MHVPFGDWEPGRWFGKGLQSYPEWRIGIRRCAQSRELGRRRGTGLHWALPWQGEHGHTGEMETETEMWGVQLLVYLTHSVEGEQVGGLPRGMTGDRVALSAPLTVVVAAAAVHSALAGNLTIVN